MRLRERAVYSPSQSLNALVCIEEASEAWTWRLSLFSSSSLPVRLIQSSVYND